MVSLLHLGFHSSPPLPPPPRVSCSPTTTLVLRILCKTCVANVWGAPRPVKIHKPKTSSSDLSLHSSVSLLFKCPPHNTTVCCSFSPHNRRIESHTKGPHNLLLYIMYKFPQDSRSFCVDVKKGEREIFLRQNLSTSI